MTNLYNRRWFKDYHKQMMALPDDVKSMNASEAKRYGDRYIDMIGAVVERVDGVLMIPLVSEDGKIISQDCQHLTRGGAKFYAKRLCVEDYFLGG